MMQSPQAPVRTPKKTPVNDQQWRATDNEVKDFGERCQLACTKEGHPLDPEQLKTVKALFLFCQVLLEKKLKGGGAHPTPSPMGKDKGK